MNERLCERDSERGKCFEGRGGKGEMTEMNGGNVSVWPVSRVCLCVCVCVCEFIRQGIYKNLSTHHHHHQNEKKEKKLAHNFSLITHSQGTIARQVEKNYERPFFYIKQLFCRVKGNY